MALEIRWYDCGNAYRVLVMDPATSGVTWVEVQAILDDPARGLPALPATVYTTPEPWGKEEAPVTQAEHIAMCKRETVLLAELAFTPVVPTTVLLRS